MTYKDLREYLEVLKKDGELKEVSCEVDWNLCNGIIGPGLLHVAEHIALGTDIGGGVDQFQGF